MPCCRPSARRGIIGLTVRADGIVKIPRPQEGCGSRASSRNRRCVQSRSALHTPCSAEHQVCRFSEGITDTSVPGTSLRRHSTGEETAVSCPGRNRDPRMLLSLLLPPEPAGRGAHRCHAGAARGVRLTTVGAETANCLPDWDCVPSFPTRRFLRRPKCKRAGASRSTPPRARRILL